MEPVKQPKPKARFGARVKPAGGGEPLKRHDEGANGVGEHEELRTSTHYDITVECASVKKKSGQTTPSQQDAPPTAGFLFCTFQDGTMTMEEEQLHLLPKVMAPYETKPGSTPRRVQIQRCASMRGHTETWCASKGGGTGLKTRH
eukprot:1137442-Pelagomonas_calceolata.AAC.8